MNSIDKFNVAENKIIDLRSALRQLDLSNFERNLLVSQVDIIQDYLTNKSWELELKQKAGQND